MNHDSIFHEPLNELCHVFIQMLDHVGAHRVGALAARLPIGQGGQRGGADFQPALGVGV